MAGKGMAHSPDSFVSSSSEEDRHIKCSYVSQLRDHTPSPVHNDEDDFLLLSVERMSSGAPPRPLDTAQNTSPGQSPIPTLDACGCPCELKDTCGQACCVEQLRAVHRARVEQVGRNNLSPQPREQGMHYGSTDDIRPMIGSVNASRPLEMGEEEEDEREGSDEPLLNTAQRNLITRTSGNGLSRNGTTSSLEQSVRCGCHVKVVDHTTRKAVMKLLVASLIALLFMVGEVLGGYFANSLAIMTDAAHMLSDFAGFLISLFAIWVSKRPPSRGMSFGWYRAEVIGALVSVLIIWVITGVLFYEAILRVVHRDFEVEANVMLITACVGVFVNVFMCMVLGHGHGHSHGGHGGHGGHGHSNRQGPRLSREERRKKKRSVENINVRAAFIHVIGDLIQSIGVVIAGYVIWFKPEWKIVDPICTFVFCVLVLISTFNILKDALRVVMEGTPKHLDYETVKADLNSVEGVKQAHSLHIWSLTLNRTALSAHLALEPGANGDDVLVRANRLLKERHNITQTTLQVEGYQEIMDECGQCQEAERTGVLHSLLPNFLRRKSLQSVDRV